MTPDPLPSTEHTLSDFDFVLPPELIAQHPAAQRSASRLLDGRAQQPVDRVFRELPDLLQAQDLLVFNDTQVMKARLWGHKPSGGQVELLVERVLPDLAGQLPHQAVVHMKVSKKPPVGAVLDMAGGFQATLLGRWPDERGSLFRLAFSASPWDLMAQHGQVPLPPYISHAAGAEDESRYQTVFARHPGAVAAPTAALHFDEALLARLDALGIARASVTLHVGAGTFQPVKSERIQDHVMHHEVYRIPAATLQAIARCRQQGARVLAVGTTTLRTLETWAASGQTEGETNLFITPGFQFRVVDLLLTNFHLPKSTLMMLVSALAGYRHIGALYQHAIAQRYRFFSYGDAMLLQTANRPDPAPL